MSVLNMQMLFVTYHKYSGQKIRLNIHTEIKQRRTHTLEKALLAHKCDYFFLAGH